MRMLELVLIGCVGVWLVYCLFAGRRALPGTVILSVLTLFALLGQLFLEGYRWQMLPVYGVALGLMISALAERVRLGDVDTRRRLGVRVGAVFGGVLLLIGAAAAALLPVPKLPPPAGPYAVGSSVYVWPDETRTAVYADGTEGPRRLVAQVWYPAARMRDGEAMPWLDRVDAVGPAIAEFFKLPAFIFNHLTPVRLNAQRNAPIVTEDGALPVIVYSHGWRGFRTVNADQLEHLASNGYFVVSVDHLHGAVGTVYPDGAVELVKPELMPPDNPKDEYQAGIERLVDMYAGDLRLVLDQLPKLNSGEVDKQFAGRLDLDRIGLFGHSTGGAAVLEVCATDPRCKACFAQDAWMEPVSQEVRDADFAKPLLLVDSEAWTDGDQRPLQNAFLGHAQGDRRFMSIAGTSHNDFVMTGLFSPLAAALGMKGPIAGLRCMEINNAYLLAFFDAYLRGTPNGLLDGPSDAFPEVTFDMNEPAILVLTPPAVSTNNSGSIAVSE